MVLDSDTFTAFLAVLALAAGATLFVVGRQSRAGPTANLWAIANVFLTVGIVLFIERAAESLAYLCLVIATALMWTAIRFFNRLPIAAPVLIGGAVVWAATAYGPLSPAYFGTRAGIYLALTAVFLFLCAWELWNGRAERLPARWPLLGLILFMGLAVGSGLPQVLSLEALGTTPEAGSLWPLYLSAIIFVVGSAVFLMSMIKERAVAELAFVAQTDNLTGLLNRGALVAAGAAVMAHTFARAGPVAAVLFDLDHFKAVNDNHGHHTGDIVLQRFAAAAIGGLRPNDLIGRIGGEEFLAVLPGVGEDAAVAIAERIRRNFADAAARVDGKPVNATVSAGVAVGYPAATFENFNALIDRADGALYVAKGAGRNRISAAAPAEVAPSTNIVRLA